MGKQVTPSVGDKVMVRLALLPGMPEDEPSDDEMEEMRRARNDPVVMRDLVARKRKEAGKKDEAVMAALNARSLQDMFFLYPRVRPARVDFVDRTATGNSGPADVISEDVATSRVSSINVEVRTLGSTVLQPAVGHYPKWAQERFRLEQVRWFDEEPEDNQDIHVAFPVPEEGEPA